MAEHTQEPWDVRHSIAGPITEVVDSEGFVICEMVMPRGGIPVSDANARLMAAAPDGLELAALVLNHYCMECVQKQARKVIDKAKGQQS